MQLCCGSIRCAAVLAAITSASAMSVSLSASVDSPAPAGTLVHWTATASGGSGTMWYRFRARALGAGFHVIKDFGPDNTLDWTAGGHDGSYEIEVTTRIVSTGETAQASAPFEMQSPVTGDQPVISATSHPLVFLYTAPPCADGSRMRVSFLASDGTIGRTPFRNCLPGVNMSFYLAGLQPGQQYTVRHTLDTGTDKLAGPDLSMTTGDLPNGLPAMTVVQPQTGTTQLGILLQAPITSQQLATDLNGNVVWYYPGTISYLTRPDTGGRFFGISVNGKLDPSHQLVREFDLTGATVLETNAARVSEQLVALGKRPITGFHHEARRLPDGNILVLAGVEQMMNDVQGPGPVDILGDMIIVLDSELQVVWAWDAFDHLDVTRQATLGEVCGGGCAPFYHSPAANDWLHGNSVERTPDGNLLYSARHQDWVIKIDYQDGVGTGDVIWRLGKDGDFAMNSTDPQPWFSHQHDPQVLADGSTITLFDNGNSRYVADATAHSRGQVLQINEQTGTASLLMNVDLGFYSYALGAAQKLPNGNYHFLAGWLPDSTSIVYEIDPNGQTVFALHVQAAEYRAFRMRDLYTPQQ
jgi:arylsulfate sulfotransferase